MRPSCDLRARATTTIWACSASALQRPSAVERSACTTSRGRSTPSTSSPQPVRPSWMSVRSTGESSHGATKSATGPTPTATSSRSCGCSRVTSGASTSTPRPIDRLDLDAEVQRWSGVRTAGQITIAVATDDEQKEKETWPGSTDGSQLSPAVRAASARPRRSESPPKAVPSSSPTCRTKAGAAVVEEIERGGGKRLCPPGCHRRTGLGRRRGGDRRPVRRPRHPCQQRRHRRHRAHRGDHRRHLEQGRRRDPDERVPRHEGGRRALKKSGHGSVVNISSMYGIVGSGVSPAYHARRALFASSRRRRRSAGPPKAYGSTPCTPATSTRRSSATPTATR